MNSESWKQSCSFWLQSSAVETRNQKVAHIGGGEEIWDQPQIPVADAGVWRRLKSYLNDHQFLPHDILKITAVISPKTKWLTGGEKCEPKDLSSSSESTPAVLDGACVLLQSWVLSCCKLKRSHSSPPFWNQRGAIKATPPWRHRKLVPYPRATHKRIADGNQKRQNGALLLGFPLILWEFSVKSHCKRQKTPFFW